MSNLYETLFSIFENVNDVNVMIFVKKDLIKLVMDKKVNIKKNEFVNINYYNNDSEIIIKGVL